MAQESRSGRLADPELTPIRRVNGRLQACDPCRSRKVSCDHTRPVCMRCRKRNQGNLCTYTLSAKSISGPSARSPLSPGRGPVSTPDLDEAGSSNVSTLKSASASPRPGGHQSRRPGYLGYTSYNSVISEARSILSGTLAQPAPAFRGMTPELSVLEDSHDQIVISPQIQQLALTVLSHVPFPEDGDILFRREITVYDATVHRIAGGILKSLYEEFGRYLGRNRIEADMQKMVRRISANTAKPVDDSLTNPDEWLRQFSGPNLRWDSLGMLFNYWYLGVEPADMVRDVGILRVRERYCTPTTQQCLASCIDLSHEFSDGSIISVWLELRKAALESMVSGDASRATTKFHSDSVSSLTFLGLHAEIVDGMYKPTLQSELKRRIVGNVYAMDKLSVAFTGRPPLLSHRFMTTPLPLDIPDDYLFSDYETLQETARTVLDAKGWSIGGGFHPSTFCRVVTMLAKIREQITEIALGNGPAPSIEDLWQLKNRHKETAAEFPQTLVYKPEDIADQNVEAWFIFARLRIRMDCLQNDFFLARLFLSRGLDDDGELLALSFELLSLTLILWTHMDRFARMRPDLEWILMGYGAPAGGVLCKELLKPTLNGPHPRNPAITRSTIIQKLSLMVGFLDWVSPSAPNGNLCTECKSVIERVLDQALNVMMPAAQAVPDMQTLGWNFAGQVDFSFDFLDTFDFLRSDL